MGADSGRLVLEGDRVRFLAKEGAELWSLEISQVRVIGEMTNDHGPFADDWFLCFVTVGGWCEAPVYAEDFQSFMTKLSDRLGEKIFPTLAASADYASNVLWPVALDGKPLFKFVDKWPRNPIGRVFVRLLGGPLSNTQTYSDEVDAYLRALESPSA